jgi:DNA-binding transcriptional ArsR family regulator
MPWGLGDSGEGPLNLVYPTSDDPKVLKAFTHPLRVEIFDRLETRVASPSAIAIDLGQPVGTVAYHVRQLCEAGLLRLVDRRARRGAIEHYYTGNLIPTISDEGWGGVPVLLKRAIIGGALHKAGLQLEAAAAHGKLDRDGANLSCLSTRLDSRGWAEVASDLAVTLLRIERMAGESKTRLTRNLEISSSEATVLIMLFSDPLPDLGTGVFLPRGGAEGEPVYHRHAHLGFPTSGAAGGVRPVTSEIGERPPIDITDARIQKAILHPLRVRLLEVLSRRVASPSEMARELGTPLATTSYHVRQLELLGLLRLVRRATRRGALEHYYTGTVTPVITGDGWIRAIDAAASEAVQEMGAQVLAAAQAGGFDRSDIHFSRTPLRLDREGAREVGRELEGLRRRLETTRRESEERALDAAIGQTVEATVLTMFFERPSTDPGGLQWDYDPAESLPLPARSDADL